MDQLALDEVEQTGGAAVFFKYLLYPVKELVNRGTLITSTPAAVQEVPQNGLLQVGTSNRKPTNNSSGQHVGGRLKTHQKIYEQEKKRL